MVGDPTGYAGPHPDIRQLASGSINQLHTINQMRQDAHDRWPPVPVTLENVAVRCRSTWYGIVDSDEGADKGNYSVAIIDVDSGGRVASFLLEAVQFPGEEEWKRYAMPGGMSRRDPAGERESVMFGVDERRRCRALGPLRDLSGRVRRRLDLRKPLRR